MFLKPYAGKNLSAIFSAGNETKTCPAPSKETDGSESRRGEGGSKM